YIRIYDRRFEIVHTHSAQDCERQLWPDATDVVDQQTKQIALRRRHETVKNLRVLPNMKMPKDPQRLTHCRKFVVARKRDENFVTNAIHIDNGLRRQCGS